MYIVTKEAVYRHEIVGLFTSLEKARLEAEAAARAEEDDHHHFNVYWFDINVPCNESLGWGGSENNELLLCKLTRKDQRVSPGSVHYVSRGEYTWEEFSALKSVLGDVDQFVYDLLNEDPQAVDAYQDIMTGRK